MTDVLSTKSPIYNISVYRKFAYIKNTYLIFILVSAVFSIWACLFLYNSFGSYPRSSPQSLLRWIANGFAAVGILVLILQLLPVIRFTRLILYTSLLFNSSYVILLFIAAFIEIPMRRIVSDAPFILVFLLPPSIGLLFLINRVLNNRNHIIDLIDDGVITSPKEIKSILLKTITDNSWRLGANDLSTTPGGLGEKIERSIINHFMESGAISNISIFTKNIDTIKKHICQIQNDKTFNMIALSLLSLSTIIYRKFPDIIYRLGLYSYEKYGAPNFRSDYDFISIAFFIVCIISSVFINRRLLFLTLNVLIWLSLFHLYHLCGSIYFIYFSGNRLLFYGILYSIILLLATAFMFQSIRILFRRSRIINSFYANGVHTTSESIILIRDGFYSLAGYLKYVEYADEDGWQ